MNNKNQIWLKSRNYAGLAFGVNPQGLMHGLYWEAETDAPSYPERADIEQAEKAQYFDENGLLNLSKLLAVHDAVAAELKPIEDSFPSLWDQAESKAGPYPKAALLLDKTIIGRLHITSETLDDWADAFDPERAFKTWEGEGFIMGGKVISKSNGYDCPPMIIEAMQWHKRLREALKDCGQVEASKKSERLSMLKFNLRRAIGLAPAKTVSDCNEKLKIMKRDHDIFTTHYDVTAALKSIQSDLERLSKEAA